MKFIAVCCFLLIFHTIFGQITSSKIEFGETHTLFSKQLNENRNINIYLPKDYHKDSSYNIIYLLDGSLHEDFYHISGIVQFFRLIFTMPNTLVVGIENVNRKRDFTFPTKDKQLKKDFPTSGGSESFIKFIEYELQPYIQNNFKTTQTKMIIGQSLGGLLASEILIKKSYLFSHYLIISPSLWWDNQSLLNLPLTTEQDKTALSTYVHISVGNEHKTMKKDAQSLYYKVKKNKHLNFQCEYSYLSKEDHATILHNSIYNSFRLLYPKFIW